MKGFVNGIQQDGTFVVGTIGNSDAFVWTKDGGMKTLVDYLKDVKGYDVSDDFAPMSILSISPNGRYLAGYGYDGGYNAFLVDLDYGTTAIDNKALAQVKASVYPNPVADELHVALPFDGSEVATTLNLYDMKGATVRSMEAAGADAVINVSSLTDGIYLLDVNAAGEHKTFKVVVRH